MVRTRRIASAVLTFNSKPAIYPSGKKYAMYELPVIRVDEAHFHIERKDGSDSSVYQLPSGPGFILDATDYSFRVPIDLAGQPQNIIQLVCGAGQIFECPWWHGKTRYVITGDTLKPAQGCERLKNFDSGEVLCLAIGRYIFPANPMGKGKFYPYWVSMISVY